MNPEVELTDEPIIDVSRPNVMTPVFVEGLTFAQVRERDHPSTLQPRVEQSLEELVQSYNHLVQVRRAARAVASETESWRRKAKQDFAEIEAKIRTLREELADAVGTPRGDEITAELKSTRMDLAMAADLLEAATTKARNNARDEADEAAAMNREGTAWRQVTKVVTQREIEKVPKGAELALQRAYLAHGGSADWASFLAEIFKTPYSMPKEAHAVLKQKVFADHGVVS